MKNRSLNLCALFLFVISSFYCKAQINEVQTILPGENLIDRLKLADMKVDANGGLWFIFGRAKQPNEKVFSRNGLAHFNGSKWELFNSSNSPIVSDIMTALAFQDSTIWLGTLNGLVSKRGNVWTHNITKNAGLLNDTVNAIFVSGKTIWIGTNYGLTKYDGISFTQYNTLNSGISNNSITAVQEDGDGNIWIGTQNGLCKQTNNGWIIYNKLNTNLKSDKINTLHLDSKKQLWIGTDSAISKNRIYPGLYKLIKDSIVDYFTIVSDCKDMNAVGLFNVNRISSSPITNSIYLKSYLPDWYGILGGRFQKMGILEIKNGISTCYDIENFSNSNIVNYNIVSLPNGNLAYTIADTLKIIKPINLKTSKERFTVSNYLDINNISAPILTNGDMHWDVWGSNYEAPKGSCKNAIFNSALWIGGLSNNNLHLAAQTYRQNGNDFRPGPMNLNGKSNANLDEKYNTIWRINRQKIEQFKINYANGKVKSGEFPVPPEFLSWPAHGDSIKGYSKYLAPFVDHNYDGKYNPMDGDYPKI